MATASAEAKTEFLQGRDLAEKLRITDSIAHFQKAASLDPNFASAELSLANAAPTGKEYCGKAANFNSLPPVNYAFIRTRAKVGPGTSAKG